MAPEPPAQNEAPETEESEEPEESLTGEDTLPYPASSKSAESIMPYPQHKVGENVVTREGGTERKKALLLIAGYSYCSCPARLRVRGDTVVHVTSGYHTHAPAPGKAFALRVKAQIRANALASSRPTKAVLDSSTLIRFSIDKFDWMRIVVGANCRGCELSWVRVVRVRVVRVRVVVGANCRV